MGELRIQDIKMSEAKRMQDVKMSQAEKVQTAEAKGKEFEYREKDRRDIIESFIKNIEDESRSQGLKFLFTVCGNVHMENIHNKLGWTVDKTAPAYETFKYL